MSDVNSFLTINWHPHLLLLKLWLTFTLPLHMVLFHFIQVQPGLTLLANLQVVPTHDGEV